MKLKSVIYKFFSKYLTDVKDVSEHTLLSYRETMQLFLKFLSQHYSRAMSELTIDHIRPKVVLDFLIHLETERNNTTRTRNLRLAAIKSLCKMIRLMYPEKRDVAEKILHLPFKRAQKRLVGFLTHEEVLSIFEAVDLKKSDGFRDYVLLHLLYDTGARASEVAGLKLNYFDNNRKTLSILGKGNRYRSVEVLFKTAELLKMYIEKYRKRPLPIYKEYIFINQRGQSLSRHGIHRICQKYLNKVLPPQRLETLNPVHSFRHGCAVNMLYNDNAVTDIRNRLGHSNIQSTMTYLHLDLRRKKEVQKEFIKHTQSLVKQDEKINELLDWENKQKILNWLDEF